MLRSRRLITLFVVLDGESRFSIGEKMPFPNHITTSAEINRIHRTTWSGDPNGLSTSTTQLLYLPVGCPKEQRYSSVRMRLTVMLEAGFPSSFGSSAVVSIFPNVLPTVLNQSQSSKHHHIQDELAKVSRAAMRPSRTVLGNRK